MKWLCKIGTKDEQKEQHSEPMGIDGMLSFFSNKATLNVDGGGWGGMTVGR